MKKIKLLVLDMDGTTYYAMGDVVPENVRPIQRAIASGIEVVFITGRPPLAKFNKIKEHGFAAKNTLLVSHNGAVIYDVKNKTVVKAEPIITATAAKVFALVHRPEFQQTVVWGYVDDLKTVITNASQPDSPVGKSWFYVKEMGFFDGQYFQITEVEKQFNYRFFKFLIFDAQPGFLKAVQELGLEVSSSNGNDAEVTAPGVNKRTALKWISQKLKIKVENTMAIGDGANDIAMIEHAGVGVAIKNSIPAVKEVADLKINLTNQEGAVAFVIENYVLKKGERNES